MDNFFFGLQAIFVSVLENIRIILAQELFWGFCLGFLISTCIHLYLITESPEHIPRMILQDADKSFAHVHKGKDPKVHRVLFDAHSARAHHAKFISILFLFIVCLGILIGLVHL